MRERRRKNFNQNYQGRSVYGKTSMLVLIVSILFTFGVLYLSQINAMVAKSGSVSKLEQKRQELQDERDRLEIEAIRLQSLKEIEKSQDSAEKTTSFNKYVPVKQINYLKTNSVALR